MEDKGKEITMSKRKTNKTNNKDMTMELEKLSQIYDKDYFEFGVSTKKSNYTDYSWERLGNYFQETASHIVQNFNPKKTLDVGCAKGFLVKSLNNLGVDSFGIDPSDYALLEAPEEIKDKLSLGVAQSIDFKDNSFDLVTCFDVMEHIAEKDVYKSLKEMLRVTNKWLILRVVTKELDDDIDTYHEKIHELEWWHQKIKKAGGIVEATEKYLDKNVWWFNVPEFLIVVKKVTK